MTRENEIRTRLSAVSPNPLPIVSAGDLRVRVPGAPPHQSCATFWQGSNPARARAYGNLLANAAPDLIYLLTALEEERALNASLTARVVELEEALESTPRVNPDTCP